MNSMQIWSNTYDSCRARPRWRWGPPDCCCWPGTWTLCVGDVALVSRGEERFVRDDPELARTNRPATRSPATTSLWDSGVLLQHSENIRLSRSGFNSPIEVAILLESSTLRPCVHQGNWELQVNFNPTSTPPQLNKTRAVIWRSAHLENLTATATQLEGKLETQLRSNSAYQFPVSWVPVQLHREFLEWRTRASPALIWTCWPELAAYYPAFGLAQSRSASVTTQSLFSFIFIRLSLHVQLIC
jgi:hypothetical protein